MARIAPGHPGFPRVLSLFLLTGLVILAAQPSGLFKFLQPAAHAATVFTVNSTGDGADGNPNDGVCNDGTGNCTLRAAIQQANATPGADTINFSVTGTINLTGSLPNITSDMTINGPGSGLLTVRRNTGGDYRLLNVFSGVTVKVSGLTLTNGKTPDGSAGSFGGRGGDGGGIFNSGALTLTDVNVTANSTGAGGAGTSFAGAGGAGGGIYNIGTLTLTNCSVNANATGVGGTGPNGAGNGGDGGGIYNLSTLTVTSCFVNGNTTGSSGDTTGTGSTGGSGGGIYSQGGTLTLTNAVVSSNVTGGSSGHSGFGGHGGGLFLLTGTATLTNSVVSSNTTGQSLGGTNGYGGGISNGAALNVTGSTICNNTGNGGAIMNRLALTLTNSTVSDNHITGPAILSNDSSSTLTLTNCTITANDNGGLIGGAPSPPTVANTIIAGNGAGKPDTSGTFNSRGHNLIGFEGGGDNNNFSFTQPGDQVGTSASPLDPHLGPLSDNGGPTFTHALLASSPALDAGDNLLAMVSSGNSLTTDQRGTGRFAASVSANVTVDIGAYEFHPSLENVSDKTMLEDATLSTSFDVGDGANDITSVTASSDNQTLLPDANLSVNGTSPIRTLTISPAANQNGTAHVTLTVNHSGGGANTDSFLLTVTPVNDAPTFTKGLDVTVAEDSGPQTLAGWATAFSAGPADESSQTLSFAVTGNTNPSLFSNAPAVSPSGALTFTSAPNANGSATITLVLKDDGGTANGGQDTSATQTFKINVTPVNDPPTANDQSVTTSEDSSRFITFTGSDVDGDVLSFSVVSGPSHGTLSGSGSSRTYTPAADFNGSDSFTFKAADPSGAESAPATVSINVTAVNDAPVNTVPGSSQVTDQNAPLVFSAAHSNAISVSDVDAGTDPLKVTLTATHGALTLGSTAGLNFTAGTGTGDATMTFAASIATINAALDGLTFNPQAGFSGTATLQLTTNDQGSTGAGGARSTFSQVFITVRPGTVEFKQSSYSVSEGAGSLAVTVRRTGDTSQVATVDYATDDGSIPSVAVPCSATTGIALDRCDFTKALGRLRFAPGEAEKSFNVLVTDDSYAEGTETALLRLSNPLSAAPLILGTRVTATLQITDNDSAPSPTNPVDDSQFFVRQHYHDFLSREPDDAGLQFWTNGIESCGADAQCRAVKRVDTSAAFFLSIEFQETGFLVYKMNKAAFGNLPNKPVPVTLSSFLPDTQRISQGLVVGATGWEQQLESNKQAFADEFVARTRFTNLYPQFIPPELYVDALNANAGGVLSQTERDSFVSALKNNVKTRAQVLRAVAENPQMTRRESNSAFVLMQYFGYLRRDPDSAPDTNFGGYNFWLTKLNSFNGDFHAAEMVRAFIESLEYRSRFGQ
jgi:CSLREA domain-containing protein